MQKMHPAFLCVVTRHIPNGGFALAGKLQIPQLLACVLLMPLASFAQQKSAPSHPHPAPQIQGRFIDSDGTHLTLHYARDLKPHAFYGAIQSTCMLPADSKSGQGKALNLSEIPLGTQMTAYYVRRVVGKRSQNVILAVRFDSLQPGSTLPKGVYIPCFKAVASPSRK